MSTGNTDGGKRTAIYLALVGTVALAVVGVVFSPSNTVSIFGFCLVVITGLFTHLSNLDTAEKVREKVEDVKTELVKTTAAQSEKLDGIAAVGIKTEMLCNSAMGRALKLTAVTARAKADITKDAADIIAAEAAEAMLKDHELKQNTVDKHEGMA